MTYPAQYRQKALRKLKEGQTIREVAEELKISTRTLQNWKNNKIPTNTRTRKPIKIDKQALLEDVQQYPDAYHYERAIRFNCSDRAIGKALKRLCITQKKDTHTSKS